MTGKAPHKYKHFLKPKTQSGRICTTLRWFIMQICECTTDDFVKPLWIWWCRNISSSLIFPIGCYDYQIADDLAKPCCMPTLHAIFSTIRMFHGQITVYTQNWLINFLLILLPTSATVDLMAKWLQLLVFVHKVIRMPTFLFLIYNMKRMFNWL